MSGHRLMAVGVLLMTTYKWLLPVLMHGIGLTYPNGVASKYYYLEDGHFILYTYLLGAFLTVVGGLLAAQEGYKRDPTSLTRFDYRGLCTMHFWSKRILVVGIQFLLAPIWCFPFVNELSIRMAAEKVGYGSFILFDMTCVGLQARTLLALYRIGFYMTLTGAVIITLEKWRSALWLGPRPLQQN